MRLWSLHPRLLDQKGLVALWREGLLALKVLQGGTKGYTQHPQLIRFRDCQEPERTLRAYLTAVWHEAHHRGYRFDPAKFAHQPLQADMTVTEGQVRFEMAHLEQKLARRAPERLPLPLGAPLVHPCFTVVPGEKAGWEKG